MWNRIRCRFFHALFANLYSPVVVSKIGGGTRLVFGVPINPTLQNVMYVWGLFGARTEAWALEKSKHAEKHGIDARVWRTGLPTGPFKRHFAAACGVYLAFRCQPQLPNNRYGGLFDPKSPYFSSPHNTARVLDCMYRLNELYPFLAPNEKAVDALKAINYGEWST